MLHLPIKRARGVSWQLSALWLRPHAAHLLRLRTSSGHTATQARPTATAANGAAVQKAKVPSFAICFLATVDLLLVFNPTGDRAEPAVMLPARGSARDKNWPYLPSVDIRLILQGWPAVSGDKMKEQITFRHRLAMLMASRSLEVYIWTCVV